MLTKYIDAQVEYMEANKELCPNGQCSIVKTAQERPQDIFDGVKIKKNHAYLYVIAMGAGDVYGENKNGDFFWEKDLIQYHKKFLNAGVFIQHDNKDPNKSIGKVLKAIYNHKMHRVELLIEIKKELAPHIYEAIELGQRIAVSMGVKVPAESCSYCGKVTKGSIANRCEHLKFYMHQIMPNGVKVFAINHPPLNFFDISIVRKPADHQGYALFQKVASVEELNDDLNKEATFSYSSMKDKVAGLKKLAELTKRIDALAAYNPLSFQRISELRATPKPLLENFLRSNDILLHPAEYLAIFRGDITPQDYERLIAGFDRPSIIRFFDEVIKRAKKLGAKRPPVVKLAHSMNEAMEYLLTREFLMKHASTSETDIDSFGNKRLKLKYTDYQRALGFNRFALLKVKHTNGETLAYQAVWPFNNIDEFLDSDTIYAIYGVLPNGTEIVITKNLYEKAKKEK